MPNCVVCNKDYGIYGCDGFCDDCSGDILFINDNHLAEGENHTKIWCCGYCRKEYDTKKEADKCPSCHLEEAEK